MDFARLLPEADARHKEEQKALDAPPSNVAEFKNQNR